MTSQREAELSMILSQMGALIERLDELEEQEQEEMSALPKRDPQRSRSKELCDGIEDAIDSLTDAIHCLEDGMNPED